MEDVKLVLFSYIIQQRAKLQTVSKAYTKDDPRFDLVYRHEADKLYMLEGLAEDSGCEITRTVRFGEVIT